MFSGVIGDHHDVQFKAHVAFPDGVDVCDVWTLLIHGSHELLRSGRQVKLSLQRVKSGICEGNLQTVKLLSGNMLVVVLGKPSETRCSHLSHLFVVMVPEVQGVLRRSVFL